MRKYTPEQQIASFWNKVQVSTENNCWSWLGSRVSLGYGHKKWNGHIELTHRISWIIAYGSIPDELLVLHSCDNPSCVRPDHLFLGTNQDNIDDKVAKGRQAHNKGETHGNARLTDLQVAVFRQRYAMGGISQRKLAKEYGIHQPQIGAIVRLKSRT